MITFSTIGNHGRLGNAMFQYAALKALAHKLNCEAKLPPDVFQRRHHGQKCLLDCFNINCSFYSENELANLSNFREDVYCNGGYYAQEFWNCTENTNLSGHFESEKYFANIKDVIKEEYELKDEYKMFASNYIKNIKEKYPDYQIIGVHIRRGDYMYPCNLAVFITTEEYNKKYLSKAFRQFSDIEKKIFLVFTGGSTNTNNDNSEDIAWCKNNIHDGDSTIIYSETNSTILDLGLMTMCDHLILNSSSTMGWWAAYLNKNENKKIVVSKNLGFKNEETYWFSSYIKL